MNKENSNTLVAFDFKASCTSEDIAPMTQYSSTSSAEEQDDIRVKHILTLHQDNVLSLCICGHTLFSGSADYTIKVFTISTLCLKLKAWEVNSFKLIKTLNGHSGSVFSLASSDHYLFSGSSDNSIKVEVLKRIPNF